MRLLRDIASPLGGLLGNQKVPSGTPVRWMQYVITEPVEEGLLLYNILTRAVALLTPEEAAQAPDGVPELVEKWFAVPMDHDDFRLAREVRAVAKMLQDPVKAITTYTILTTTDCNARCFYCYEKGRSRIPMSRETARKVAEYIIRKSSGEPVKLRWFGGEPLYNKPVITQICNLLREAGVEFRSSMVSNGLLFDDTVVAEAGSLWNLKKVQITLDGTEKVYNRVKAFVDAEGSPYRRVLDNIARLLDAGIKVTVRLNIDLHNAEDLFFLMDELGDRFPGRKNLRVYSRPLFQNIDPGSAVSHTEEQRRAIHEARMRLDRRIHELGFQKEGVLGKSVKVIHCMADNDASVTILPDGHLGKCEHYTDRDWFGHIGREEKDDAVLVAFKACHEDLPECAECPVYPDCIRLRKCEEAAHCYLEEREERLAAIHRCLQAFYEKEVGR